MYGTQQELDNIENGDVLPTQLRFQSQLSPATVATLHLKALMKVSHGIFEKLEHRRNARNAMYDHKSLFAVGDIVRHKKYGFRGVVLALCQ